MDPILIRNPIKVWHFLAGHGRLGYNDGRKVRLAWRNANLVICPRIACRVGMSGMIVIGGNKIVASERKVIKWLDLRPYFTDEELDEFEDRADLTALIYDKLEES